MTDSAKTQAERPISRQADPRSQTRQEGSVAAEVGTVRRNLQMRWFASEQDHLDVGYHKTPRVLGQVVGAIFTVEERMGRLPSGEQKPSLVAIGKFEATNYATGEVVESFTAYLPQYYLQVVRGMLGQGVQGVSFAIEIVLKPTMRPPPAIQTTYEIKNLARVQADDPVNLMKRELEATGRSRLSPAVTVQRSPLAIEHKDVAEGLEIITTEDAEIDPELELEPEPGQVPGDGDVRPGDAGPKAKARAAAS